MNNKRYIFSEIFLSFPPEKKKADGTMSKFFYRPLSWPLTWIFLNLQFSANSVTWISIGVSILACGLTLIPSLLTHVIAVCLYMLFGILDCVDGNMARVQRSRSGKESNNNVGEWVDALGGYTTYVCISLSLGLSTMLLFPEYSSIWLIIALVLSSANLLMRLAFQSWRVISSDPASRKTVGSEKRFSEEIGITGFMQFVYIAGLIFGFLHLVLIAYAIIFCGGCVLSVSKLAIKANRM